MPCPQYRSLSRPIVLGAVIALASAASAQQTAAPANRGVEKSLIMKQQSDDWLDVTLKARSMLFDPATGEGHMVMDPDPPMGIPSPDGKRIAYIASDPQRVKDGHDFDLFVADVDQAEPSGKANARRLTTDQQRPSSPHWLPESSGIAFLAGDSPSSQVWYIDLAPDSQPVRLSDGQHRAYDLSITSSGRIAWIVHKGGRNKQQFKDLVLHPSPATTGKMRTLLTDQHVSGYAISPEGKTLAWSGLGSMFLVNLDTGESREIPLHGIHPQLLHHTVHQFAWRPDGKLIAIHCGFLGGISVGPGEKFPRWFAEDKVFFVPVDWMPGPESLKVGEGDDYPSPTVDDPKAEVSPPAGDQSKPWWVRDLPMRPLEMKWISAEQAKKRIEKHAAPPEEKIEPPSTPSE